MKGTANMLDELPNDSDGNALRQLVLDGSDLSKPLSVDFAVDVPDGDTARTVATAVSPLGFQPDCYYDAESNSWSCYCTKTIIPTYDLVVAIQRQLDDVSRPFGGKSDGWGSFGNATGPKAK